jgi:putative protein kinase ArgK-like GTPase of G3E family
VIEEGRAVVIAVNKTNLPAEDRSQASKQWRKLRDRLEASFAQVKDAPIVGISALNGRGMDRLMPKVFETYHPVGRPARRTGRRLPALPDQPPARRFRPARRADPPHHAQAEEPLREPRQNPPVRAPKACG